MTSPYILSIEVAGITPYFNRGHGVGVALRDPVTEELGENARHMMERASCLPRALGEGR